MNKVSIIIPVYNVEKYLEKCCNSILNQTYKNIELLLINDGSTDNSLDVCNRIKKGDQRVIIIDGPNKGVSYARNEGIKKATGEYIMFSDSDDYYEKDYVEKMLNKICNSKVDFVVAENYYKDDDEKKNCDIDFEIENSKKILKEHLLFRFTSSIWTCIIRTNIAKKVKFTESLTNYEDWEYIFQIIQECDKIATCKGCYYHYITRQGSASKSPIDKKKMGMFNIPNEVRKKIKDKNNYKEYLDILNVLILLRIIVIYSSAGCKEKKFVKELRKIAISNLKNALKSKHLLAKQKVYIILISIHPICFKELYKLKNGRK